MSVAIDKSVMLAKVNVGSAPTMAGDRIFNSSQVLCMPWNGTDTIGRRVCPDSTVTLSAGCNSANDRILVENSIFRPTYSDALPLNLRAMLGEGPASTSYPAYNAMVEQKAVNNVNKFTAPNTGVGYSKAILSQTGLYPNDSVSSGTVQSGARGGAYNNALYYSRYVQGGLAGAY